MADSAGPGDRLYKRPFDLAVLVFVHLFPLLLPVWLLLWALIPLLIWLDDRGPIFYRQQRPGKNGRMFTVLKFRTMVTDADKIGPAWTVEQDPRITRVGRFLRPTALDELPEVLGIWKGDMSLVGPRALPAKEHAYLEQKIPGFRERLRVRPGLTGLSQVHNRGDDSATKLGYDLDYIRRMSIWLDVRLLAMSVFNTLFARWDERAAKEAASPANTPSRKTDRDGDGTDR